MNAVRVGTSGWSYPTGHGTWNGLFYPERGTRGFRAADELSYYAEHFETVEVNSTFYRPPAAATTARCAKGCWRWLARSLASDTGGCGCC